MTNIRISQEAIEALVKRFPNIRASQVSIETLVGFQNLSNIRQSQVSIEALISYVAPTPTEGRILGPPVQVI